MLPQFMLIQRKFGSRIIDCDLKSGYDLSTIVYSLRIFNSSFRERIKSDKNGRVLETGKRVIGNYHQARKLKKGVNILVSTVGQCLHFLKAGLLNFGKLDFVAIDESDQLLMPSRNQRCDYLENLNPPFGLDYEKYPFEKGLLGVLYATGLIRYSKERESKRELSSKEGLSMIIIPTSYSI